MPPLRIKRAARTTQHFIVGSQPSFYSFFSPPTPFSTSYCRRKLSLLSSRKTHLSQLNTDIHSFFQGLPPTSEEMKDFFKVLAVQGDAFSGARSDCPNANFSCSSLFMGQSCKRNIVSPIFNLSRNISDKLERHECLNMYLMWVLFVQANHTQGNIVSYIALESLINKKSH